MLCTSERSERVHQYLFMVVRISEEGRQVPRKGWEQLTAGVNEDTPIPPFLYGFPPFPLSGLMCGYRIPEVVPRLFAPGVDAQDFSCQMVD